MMLWVASIFRHSSRENSPPPKLSGTVIFYDIHQSLASYLNFLLLFKSFEEYFYCFVSVQISPAVLEVEGDGVLTVSPPWMTARPVPSPTSRLKKLRLKAKDYRKGGDGLRGKNVTEAYRVKEKDLKRTMK